jgi:hypothetical protein
MGMSHQSLELDSNQRRAVDPAAAVYHTLLRVEGIGRKRQRGNLRMIRRGSLRRAMLINVLSLLPLYELCTPEP